MKLPVLLRRRAPVVERQSWDLNSFATMLYNGQMYGFGYPSPSLAGKEEPIDNTYSGLGSGAYKGDSVVFACIAVRQLLFSEARFQWRRFNNGRPTDLFGTPDLGLLEQPWPNGTTRDLLVRAELDVSLCGNFFCVRRPGPVLQRLRPDWVTIVLTGEQGDVDARPAGYIYQPGGRYSGRDAAAFDVSEVAHYAPLPDPDASFRGMSWLTPVIQEILADKAATRHKLKFFENGATPSLIGKTIITDQDKLDRFAKRFRDQQAGVDNAYKTLWLAAGADVTAVGVDFKQLEFKATQGAGETRIAAAAQVPPVIVGLSEGLGAATYSNYATARRRFADATIRPLWASFAGAIQKLITNPGSAQLWYDDRDIPFVREDLKDQAEIMFTESQALRTLVDGGFDPVSAVAAISNRDLSRLVHTGLTSVQLVPPGTGSSNGATNGSGNPDTIPAPA